MYEKNRVSNKSNKKRELCSGAASKWVFNYPHKQFYKNPFWKREIHLKYIINASEWPKGTLSRNNNTKKIGTCIEYVLQNYISVLSARVQSLISIYSFTFSSPLFFIGAFEEHKDIEWMLHTIVKHRNWYAGFYPSACLVFVVYRFLLNRFQFDCKANLCRQKSKNRVVVKTSRKCHIVRRFRFFEFMQSHRYHVQCMFEFPSDFFFYLPLICNWTENINIQYGIYCR